MLGWARTRESDHGADGAGDHEQGHRNGGVLATESGDWGDGAGGDPLDEVEDGGVHHGDHTAPVPDPVGSGHSLRDHR